MTETIVVMRDGRPVAIVDLVHRTSQPVTTQPEIDTARRLACAGRTS